MDVPIVFLNCQNLYQVGQHTTRSPGSASQLAQKVADLAQTVLKVFGGPPALIGLCEVGERALAQQVADAVAPSLYQGLWSGPPPKSRSGEPHTALVLLHDPARLALTGKQDQGPKSVSARCKWLAVELQAAGGSFWAVVVHWKSRYGASRAMTEPGRANSAREIGEFWLTQGRQTSQAIILLGDLNCEPGEAPLQEQANRTGRPNQLRATRERALVLRDRNRLVYFYNPMWRWMAEPDILGPGGQVQAAPQPWLLGTYCADWGRRQGWSMFDHILANRQALEGRPWRLVESSLKVVAPVRACSDHCAVGAILEV